MAKSYLQQPYQVSEVELIYRNKIPVKDRLKVHNSTDAYNIFSSTWDEGRIELVEQFKILLLNRGNACLGLCEITTGGTAFCPVDPKMVFSTALKANAAAIILAHNHPSGNAIPSESDKQLTTRLTQSGALLNIFVADHLILTSHAFYSFGDEGLMPKMPNQLSPFI